MKQVILLFTAAITALQGAPPILNLYLHHEGREIGKQQPFTNTEWICLSLCCLMERTTIASQQSATTNINQCLTDACTGVCDTVCCVSGMVTPILSENFVLDSARCLKHTCKETQNGTRWEETPMPCKNCGSQFVKIPGQCCPHCISESAGEWGEWCECSVSCGQGLQSSVRPCYKGETAPTTHCPERTLRTQICDVPCPVPCKWEWTNYSDCPVSCGGGLQVRRVNITQVAQNGGTPCPDEVINATELRECNTVPCPASCEWIWSEMSECTVTCGGGTQYRYPILSQAPSKGGEPCPYFIIMNKTEKYQCNLHHCPVGCLWRWSSFSDCSSSCKDGLGQNRERYPIVIEPAMYGGTPCPDVVETNHTEDLKCRDEICQLSRVCEAGEVVCNGECIIDSDKDCIPDDQDNCPFDPRPSQIDRDGDGVGDLCDNCPYIWNQDQDDRDRDTVGDVCDNCRDMPNYYQENQDSDDWGDVCDKCPYKSTARQLDQDNDGWGDHCDNCPYLPNPDQEDRDHDFLGYKCEADKDGDGTVNQFDNCPLLYNPDQRDDDRDRVGDACQFTQPEPPSYFNHALGELN